jgi:acyl dehydratase
VTPPRRPVHAVSPARFLDPADAGTVIGLGGYTHPLFTDPAHLASSPFATRPWPGQALLLVMGGLAEQTGLYDGWAVALLGFESVSFAAPACDGDTVTVEIEELDVTPGRRYDTGRFAWRARRADGTLLADVVARFLLQPGPAPDSAVTASAATSCAVTASAVTDSAVTDSAVTASAATASAANDHHGSESRP